MAYRAPSSTAARRARGRRRLDATWRWILDRRIVRAGMRYHFGRAALFSGGVTYSAVISLTAVLTILVNVGRAFLAHRPDLLNAALGVVNDVSPGLIDDGTNDGIVDPASLVIDSFWHPVTMVSTVVVLWTALSVMTGLRRSIRAMFGLGGAPLPFHVGKARDLLGFLLLALGIGVSVFLSTAVSVFGRPILDWLGVTSGATAVLLGVAAILAAGLVDALVFMMLFRVTAGVRIPRRDLLAGALVGGVGSGLLRLAGTSVVGVVQDPFLASFAAVATLLLWLNLAVRLTLVTAAWTANPPAAPLTVAGQSVHARETPNYVTRSVPSTLHWPYHAVTGSLLPTDPDGAARNVEENGHAM